MLSCKQNVWQSRSLRLTQVWYHNQSSRGNSSCSSNPQNRVYSKSSCKRRAEGSYHVRRKQLQAYSRYLGGVGMLQQLRQQGQVQRAAALEDKVQPLQQAGVSHHANHQQQAQQG